MGSDKRRERIEKEQELATQIHLIASAQASIEQSHRKLRQIEADYLRQLHAERSEVQSQLDKLTKELEKQQHRRELLELKAPYDGVIKDLATHTAGTVVQPGTVLASLVPRDEKLKAEVWISNEDIGFVHRDNRSSSSSQLIPFRSTAWGMVWSSMSVLMPRVRRKPATRVWRATGNVRCATRRWWRSL